MQLAIKVFMFCFVATLLSCNSCNNVPYKYRVTAFFASENKSDSLFLLDGEHRITAIDQLPFAPAKIFLKPRIVEGHGLQPSDGWIIMATEQDLSIGGSSVFSGSSSIGNTDWLLTHEGNLMVASELSGVATASTDFGYSRSDSVILAGPGAHLFGATYFIHLKSTDDIIPWHHDDVVDAVIDPNCFIDSSGKKCIDMESLSKTFYENLVATFNSAVARTHNCLDEDGNDTCSVKLDLAGSNNNGDFGLYFMPQTQYKTTSASASDGAILSPGFGFYFQGVLKASWGILSSDLRITIPIFIFF